MVESWTRGLSSLKENSQLCYECEIREQRIVLRPRTGLNGGERGQEQVRQAKRQPDHCRKDVQKVGSQRHSQWHPVSKHRESHLQCMQYPPKRNLGERSSTWRKEKWGRRESSAFKKQPRRSSKKREGGAKEGNQTLFKHHGGELVQSTFLVLTFAFALAFMASFILALILAFLSPFRGKILTFLGCNGEKRSILQRRDNTHVRKEPEKEVK